MHVKCPNCEHVFGICDIPDCEEPAVIEGWYRGNFCGVHFDETILVRLCEEHKSMLEEKED